MSCSRPWSGQLLFVVDSSQWREAKPVQMRRTQEWILSHNSVIYISGTWLRKHHRRGKKKELKDRKDCCGVLWNSQQLWLHGQELQKTNQPTSQVDDKWSPGPILYWGMTRDWELLGEEESFFFKNAAIGRFLCFYGWCHTHHIWAALTGFSVIKKNNKRKRKGSWERGMLEARGEIWEGENRGR